MSDISLRQIFCLLSNNNLRLLNKPEILIVTTNSLGLTLGLLQRLGLIKTPIMFFVMGLIPLKHTFVKAYDRYFPSFEKIQFLFLPSLFHPHFLNHQASAY